MDTVIESDTSKVIDDTDRMEGILSEINHKYICPRKEAYGFIWDVLLDSSVMPLGSKIKVVMAISQILEVKLKRDSLHEVVRYRNAFAHHRRSAHPTLSMGETPGETRAGNMLHTQSHSGKVNRIYREDALEEFEKHIEKAKESLFELYKRSKMKTYSIPLVTHNKRMQSDTKSVARYFNR